MDELPLDLDIVFAHTSNYIVRPIDVTIIGRRHSLLAWIGKVEAV